MLPWKAAALIVSAGLVLGMTAGAASRPVMVQKARDYWPASVEEKRIAMDAPQPIYEGGPQDLTPGGYSFRPDLDYSATASPDQSEPLYTIPEEIQAPQTEVAPLPELHRASPLDAVADRAEAAAEDALAAAAAPPADPETAAPQAVPTLETAAF